MLKSSFSLEGVRRGNGPAGARSSNTLRHLCQLSLNTARLNSPKRQPGQKCAPTQRRGALKSTAFGYAQLLGGQTDHTCDYPINYYTLFTAFTVNNPVKESLNYVNYVILLSGL